jgi:AGCS family alanine or glycine:cation symporter
VKWFAVLFAVVSIISAGVLLPGVQANSVADGIQNAFEIDVEIWNSSIFNICAIVFGGKESPNSQNLSFHNGHYLYCNCIGDHSDRYRSTWSYRFIKSAFNMEAGFGAVLV